MATDSQRSAETKAKIFISYSRKDIDLADRIEAELSARGFVPLVDRTAIHAFEDWWKRIERLILEADTVVALLTPDFIESEICAREIGFAQALHKRFAPVLCKPVDPQRVTEALARLNFLAFDSGSDDAMERLSTALLTDIGWIRKQTEFGQAAQRWFDAGRPGPRGLLLRSPVLEEAEAWIAARPSDAPAPNDVTRAFIIESRRAANKRRRVLVSTLAAGLVGAVALAGNALWQWRLAVEQRTFADQQRNEALRQRQLADASASEAKSERDRALITQSRFLSDLARQKARTGDHATAALLSVEALPDRTRSDRPHVPEAEAALFDATLHITEASVLPSHTRMVVVPAVRARFSSTREDSYSTPGPQVLKAERSPSRDSRGKSTLFALARIARWR